MCGRDARGRDLGQGPAGAVAFGDLAVEAAFVPGQGVGSIGAAEDDELGCERSEAFDLLHRFHGLLRLDGA